LAITARGIVVAVVAAALYGLAWVSQIGWFYVADAMALALLLVNLPFAWVNLRGVSAQRRLLSQPRANAPSRSGAFEEDEASVAIDVGGRGWVPRLLMTVREACPIAPPAEREHSFLIGSLPSKSPVTATYQVRCYQRGVYQFPPLEVESSAPFGLFRFRRRLPAPAEVTVYPQVLKLGAPAPRGLLLEQTAMAGRAASSGEFRGARRYQPGDLTRNIHWRNSARTGALMVKEFDTATDGDLRVAFNPGIVLGEGRETTLEYGIKVSVAVTRWAFQSGRAFRLWPSPSQGAGSTWHGTLEFLARLQAHESASIRDALGHPGPSGVMVAVVSEADVESLRLLATLRPQHGRVVAVLLQGFGEDEHPGARGMLQGAGMTVVRCRKGQMAEAMDSLGRALGLQGASSAPVRRGAVAASSAQES